MEYKVVNESVNDPIVWKQKLKLFCVKNALISSNESATFTEGKSQFLLKVMGEIFSEIESEKTGRQVIDWKYIELLCDSLRIACRSSVQTGVLIESSTNLFQNLLYIVACPIPCSTTTATTECTSAISCCLRCLTNMLYVIQELMGSFFQCDGITVLMHLLSRHTQMRSDSNSSSSNSSNSSNMGGLQRQYPSQILYFAVRLLHMLSSSTPTAQSVLQWHSHILSLVQLLCDTVSSGYALGSGECLPFPIGDKRGELYIELVKLLYSLRVFELFEVIRSGIDFEPESFEGVESHFAMALLKVVTSSDPSAIALDCRQYSYQLLMCATDSVWLKELSNNVAFSGFVPCSLSALHLKLMLLDDSSFSEDAMTTAISPIVAVLIRLATASQYPHFRRQLYQHIFPISTAAASTAAVAGEERDELAPEDSPKGSLRYSLIQLMTSTNLQLKRLSAELLFEVCDQDKEDFIKRTGFGNAVALLQGKGLLSELVPTK